MFHIRFRSSLLLLAFCPLPAAAQDVLLKSYDGAIEMDGQFLRIADDAYVIRSEIGDLRIAIASVSCEGAGCPDLDQAVPDLRIAGAGTLGSALLQDFTDVELTDEGDNVVSATDASDLTYHLAQMSAADAFAALLDGTADMALSPRRILPVEARALRDAGAGNMVDAAQEHLIAVNQFAVITHPDNPVDSLTLDELRAIYTGDVANWVDVGGADQPVNLVLQRDVMLSKGMLDGVSDATPQAQIADDPRADIAADPGGIAILSGGAAGVALVDSCGVTRPMDAFAAKTEEYPLHQRAYLYQRADLDNAQAVAFVDYAAGSEAYAVISQAGFVDLGVAQRAQADRAVGLDPTDVNSIVAQPADEMQQLFTQFDRLSSTFHFKIGASGLDNRAEVDMARLADYLAAQPAGVDVMFVGFTNDIGSFDSNFEISRARAVAVRDQFVAFADLPDITFDTAGFGELAPVGCNLTDHGRRINQRVEVWLRTP